MIVFTIIDDDNDNTVSDKPTFDLQDLTYKMVGKCIDMICIEEKIIELEAKEDNRSLELDNITAGLNDGQFIEVINKIRRLTTIDNENYMNKVYTAIVESYKSTHKNYSSIIDEL